MIRAEALFRHFQRTVEAVDRKQHFPTPGLRHRKPSSAGPSKQTAASTSAGSSSAVVAAPTQKPGETIKKLDEEEKSVISPELRQLLSTEIPRLKKEEIMEHGGGIN